MMLIQIDFCVKAFRLKNLVQPGRLAPWREKSLLPVLAEKHIRSISLKITLIIRGDEQIDQHGGIVR
jgi:hypothetical protein